MRKTIYRFFVIIIFSVLIASCGGGGGGDDSVDPDSDPCGTVIDLGSHGDYIAAEFQADDCRFKDIAPKTKIKSITPEAKNRDFVDEYRITLKKGGPVKIKMLTRCSYPDFPEMYLLNTSKSCSNGCSNFDGLLMAEGYLRCDRFTGMCDAQIDIDLIAGTYLLLTDGPASLPNCNRYGLRTAKNP